MPTGLWAMKEFAKKVNEHKYGPAQPSVIGVTDVTDNVAPAQETLLGRAKRKSGYQDTRTQAANTSWYKTTLG